MEQLQWQEMSLTLFLFVVQESSKSRNARDVKACLIFLPFISSAVTLTTKGKATHVLHLAHHLPFLSLDAWVKTITSVLNVRHSIVWFQKSAVPKKQVLTDMISFSIR